MRSWRDADAVFIDEPRTLFGGVDTGGMPRPSPADESTRPRPERQASTFMNVSARRHVGERCEVDSWSPAPSSSVPARSAAPSPAAGPVAAACRPVKYAASADAAPAAYSQGAAASAHRIARA